MQAEADDQQDGECDLALCGRVADRQPFGEVVQADPDRDEQREPARAVSADGPLEVHQPEQSGGDAQGEDRHHEREGPDTSVGPETYERLFHRGARVAQDVPQQEDQDPGRERIQEALDRFREPMEPRHRQAEENGGAGDGSQENRSRLAHSGLIGLVRAKGAIR